MSTITGLDWDAWRNAYPTLTYAEQQAFHSEIYAQYPEQRHYNATYVAKAIEDTLPSRVLELGGWDGELAADMLSLYPTISAWANVEICREALFAGMDRHPRYEPGLLTGFYWDQGPWYCDLFIASHTIEHLSAHHLQQTIASTRAQAIYLDAPLMDWPTNWMGSTTSHVLEIGWLGVNKILNDHGYQLEWQEDHGTEPNSGGHARACLYRRSEQ